MEVCWRCIPSHQGPGITGQPYRFCGGSLDGEVFVTQPGYTDVGGFSHIDNDDDWSHYIPTDEDAGDGMKRLAFHPERAADDPRP
jgi:hypothetical protein